MSDPADARGVSGNLGPETVIVSVGIDVGSSTTHLTLSRIVIGRLDSHFHRKPEILRREVFYQSPVIFTPFLANGAIDVAAISAFVAASYDASGTPRDSVDTGAVICTGEAAKRENARAITAALARDSGRFVCATAGHHFEAILAAHGSGAVQASYDFDEPVINLDIGGGTSKRSLIKSGEIAETSAINIGARLIAFDEEGRISRLEDAGRRIAAGLGIAAETGVVLRDDERERLTARMAAILTEFIGFAPLSQEAHALLLTEAPEPLPQRLIQLPQPVTMVSPFRLVCSGGVAEFIHGRSDARTNDLGPSLGRAILHELERRLKPKYLLHPHEGIRATVVGASQFTLQASGDTVFVSHPSALPVSSIPVVTARVDWSNVVSADVTRAIKEALARADQPERYALFLGGPRFFGYGSIARVAQGIVDALPRNNPPSEIVYVFAHNVANTVGGELRRLLPADQKFVCIDEIDLGPLNFLDIGVSPAGETYVPVIVKSLVFPSGDDRRQPGQRGG